jgi:MFS family permease
MVALLWLIYLINMGFPLYGGTVIINAMREKDIPMSGMVYGIGFSLVNLFVGIGAIPAGFAVIRYGIRKTFAMGSGLLIVGALFLATVATQPWHYLVAFGFLVGMGMAMGTMIPLATTITRWFVRYRGRAMAIALTASGAAGLAAAPTIRKLIAEAHGNWHLAWIAVAAACALSAVLAILFIKERPQDFGQVPDGLEPTDAVGDAAKANPLFTMRAWTPSEVYRNRSYWVTVLAAACSQWPFFFFTAHWIPHLKARGISPAEAAFAMGLFTMGGIIGRLVSGWLMDRIAARFTFMLGFCCYFIGTFLALQASPATLSLGYIAAVCYGAAFGWCFVAQQTMLGHFFGPVAFPKINGNLMAIAAVLVCASATVGGKLFDVFKVYDQAFYLNMAMGVAGICLLFFATMPQSPADETPAASVAGLAPPVTKKG